MGWPTTLADSRDDSITTTGINKHSLGVSPGIAGGLECKRHCLHDAGNETAGGVWDALQRVARHFSEDRWQAGWIGGGEPCMLRLPCRDATCRSGPAAHVNEILSGETSPGKGNAT